MGPTPILDLGAKVNKHDRNANWSWSRISAFLYGGFEVVRIVKVEFLDRRKARYAIRAQHKVQSLTNCALAYVVGTHQESVAVELQFC